MSYKCKIFEILSAELFAKDGPICAILTAFFVLGNIDRMQEKVNIYTRGKIHLYLYAVKFLVGSCMHWLFPDKKKTFRKKLNLLYFKENKENLAF